MAVAIIGWVQTLFKQNKFQEGYAEFKDAKNERQKSSGIQMSQTALVRFNSKFGIDSQDAEVLRHAMATSKRIRPRSRLTRSG